MGKLHSSALSLSLSLFIFTFHPLFLGNTICLTAGAAYAFSLQLTMHSLTAQCAPERDGERERERGGVPIIYV